MLTLKSIPFLMGSWHLGLSSSELSLNSIPVTNLEWGEEEGGSECKGEGGAR